MCDACARPLVGDENADVALCDGCLSYPMPWSKGRAVALYDGAARRVTMALKHGDRLDVARPMGAWMADVAQDILTPDCILVPIPLHRFRLLKRKYNQSALLAHHIAGSTGHLHLPDGLLRVRRTIQQKGMDRLTRFENQKDAFQVNERWSDTLKLRQVVLVDDVMTSGATLASAAECLFQLGVDNVSVLVFARVAKAE